MKKIAEDILVAVIVVVAALSALFVGCSTAPRPKDELPVYRPTKPIVYPQPR